MKPSHSAASPAADPALRVIAELNQLRAAAGMPSYRKLAASTNYSRSTLWRATRGSRLPARDITLALAAACGGDIAEWDRKWRAADAQASQARTLGRDDGTTAALSRVPAPPQPPPPAPRRTHRWLMPLIATATVVLAAVTFAIARSATGTSAAAAHAPVSLTRAADGADPYVSKCAIDEQRLEYQNLYWPNHKLYGWVELYHSHICDASWGYVFGPNSARWEVTIIARRLPGNTTAPSSITANDPPNSWGNVLSTPLGTCVRVEAYITVGVIRGPVAVTSCQPDRTSGGIAPRQRPRRHRLRSTPARPADRDSTETGSGTASPGPPVVSLPPFP